MCVSTNYGKVLSSSPCRVMVLILAVLSCGFGCGENEVSRRGDRDVALIQMVTDRLVSMIETEELLKKTLQPVVDRKLGVVEFLSVLEGAETVPAGTLRKELEGVELWARGGEGAVTDRLGQKYVCVVSYLGKQDTSKHLYGVWCWPEKRHTVRPHGVLRGNCWYFEMARI